MWRRSLAALLIGAAAAAVAAALGEAGLSAWAAGHARLLLADLIPAGPGAPAAVLRWTVAFAGSLAAAWVTVRATRAWQGCLFAACVALLACAACPVLALYGIAFEPTGAVIGSALAALGALVYRRASAAGRRAETTALAAGRLADRGLAAIAADPFCFKPSGEAREVAVLSVRVLDTRILHEEEGAARALQLADTALANAERLLLDAGAYVELRTATELRVLFGYPLADPEATLAAPAIAAARAALALRAQLEIESDGPRTGLGIAAGELALGRIGGEGARAQLGALGPEPDLASQLAAANADYATGILAAAPLYAALSGEAEFRPIDFLPAASDPGKPLEVFELLGLAGDLGEMARMRRDAFWRGVVHLRAGDRDRAAAAFREAEAPGNADPVLERFLAHSRPDRQSTAGDAAEHVATASRQG